MGVMQAADVPCRVDARRCSLLPPCAGQALTPAAFGQFWPEVLQFPQGFPRDFRTRTQSKPLSAVGWLVLLVPPSASEHLSVACHIGEGEGDSVQRALPLCPQGPAPG